MNFKSMLTRRLDSVGRVEGGRQRVTWNLLIVHGFDFARDGQGYGFGKFERSYW